MDQKSKTAALDLEVDAVEAHCRPGCGTSTTSSLCTCPISSSTGSKLSSSAKS